MNNNNNNRMSIFVYSIRVKSEWSHRIAAIEAPTAELMSTTHTVATWHVKRGKTNLIFSTQKANENSLYYPSHSHITLHNTA